MNNFVPPHNTRTETYAGRVACCNLLSHVEYAPRAVLRLQKWWERRMYGRQTDALRLPLDAGSVMISNNNSVQLPEHAARLRIRLTSKQVLLVMSCLYIWSVVSFSPTNRLTMWQKIDSSIPVRTICVASFFGRSTDGHVMGNVSGLLKGSAELYHLKQVDRKT